MKKSIVVLYEENRNNPVGTWSGIPYQLRESLKKYFNVIFVDSNDTKVLSIIKAVSKRIEKKTISHVLKPFYEKMHKKLISEKLKNYKNIPVLEISENVDVDNDFYLYRDMSYACYPYVLDKFKDDKNNYGHGMLKHVSKDALTQRIVNEEKLVNKSKGTFFMGQWTVELLKDIYPNEKDKFIAVGGGLSKEFENLSIDKTYNKKILFCGLDYLRKGGDLVEEAFNILKQKYDKDAELIIAGPEINNHIEGVTYTGKINKKELSKYFNDCTVFCMPSRFEAYGLVFLEAQCYGLPIVAVDDYEMHHFVKDGENGYLVKNYDAEELAEALHKALNNKEMINNVINNASSFQKEHTWDAVAKKIADIINERSYFNEK